MRKLLLATAVLVAFVSCSSLHEMSKNMYNTVPEEYVPIQMKVDGLDGWLPKRNIRFGEYSALKIKRGATKGSTALFFPDINVNTNLHKKTSFTQNTPWGGAAQVYALEEFSEKGIRFNLNKAVAIESLSEVKHLFSGKIILNEEKTWNFQVECHGNGIAENNTGEQIEIQVSHYGYRFIKNGRLVAGFASGVFEKNWSPLSTVQDADMAFRNSGGDAVA